MQRPLSPEQREQLQTWKVSYPHFASGCLKVKTKAGLIEPFKFNSAQQFIHDRLERQKADTGKVRALILKARQQGVSTYVGGRFYHRTQFFQGTSVFILTHEQPATDTLFSMVERFWRNSPQEGRLKTGAANAKEMNFPSLDSGYGVGTAGAKAVGRSKTLQCFHGSEVGFWPGAADHFAGVVQAVPDLPDTEVILESTANGIGGEFHERWTQAEASDGDYIPIFVPWFWSDEYERAPPRSFEPTAEEEHEAKLYDLSLPKLAWRRAKIAELKDPARFKQEYPSSAQEAFQATGHESFIPSRLVQDARKRQCEAIGSLVIGVDPARFGDDSFCIAWRTGRKVHKIGRKHRIDNVAGANWVKSIIDQDQPVRVFIDVGGQGSGVVDILRDFGEPYSTLVVEVNFGGAPQDLQKTNERGELVPGSKNRRAEMWSRLRDWLEDEGGADLPDDNSVHADLCAPGYRFDMRQYLVLESKEDIRKRGLRSPDSGDAIALTFASPVAARGSITESDRDWRRRRQAGGPSVWAL
jgi:hypothetical protein